MRPVAWVGSTVLIVMLLVPSCQTPSIRTGDPGPADLALQPAQPNHLAEVMTSAFCGKCHPAMYAEHNQNTHGRAFTDTEPRLATGRFTHGDCIRCHTPRPIFETGIGMNPMIRHHNLEEGNTCMTCHWRPDFDYSDFRGGSECRAAFHPDVGAVQACAACHRNHGTPYQWEKAPTGKAAGTTCMSCHMQGVIRPVAVGEEPRLVKSHVFPGSRSEPQLRKAYEYAVRIEDDAVVVRVSNSGTGHNFPTELKQRSVESLIIVKDTDGQELYRSRMVFRDPYKRPYGLHLLVNTQIPAGEFREHRVPLKVAAGTVQTELHFKLYFPIEDNHPELARQLERRVIPFDEVQPSEEAVVSDPVVKIELPEGVGRGQASPANFVDFVKLPIGTTEVPIPLGSGPEDISKLVDLFMFPVPQAQVEARERLTSIGRPAVPALIEAMGSWDNKTWKNAMQVLFTMGDRVRPDLVRAVGSEQLYVRIHARELLGDLGPPLDDTNLAAVLMPGLSAANALDRASAAQALGRLKLRAATPQLRSVLTQSDPDVVRAAALALADLDDTDSVPTLRRALAHAPFVETRRDLAKSLALLGDASGIPLLLEGLDHPDDLIRESFFEALFAVTRLHLGYDPLAPRPQRLEAISRLGAYWVAEGSPDKLHRPWPPSQRTHARAWSLVQELATDESPSADAARIRELVGLDADAVPALLLGLKYPVGFAARRALVLSCLREIGSVDAAPFVAAALRDPVVGVASWACQALATIGDPATLPALHYYHDRLLSERAAGTLPASVGHPDFIISQSAATRLVLGDRSARPELASFLLSDDLSARRTAHSALTSIYQERHGYEPDGPVDLRRAAARRWQADRTP